MLDILNVVQLNRLTLYVQDHLGINNLEDNDNYHLPSSVPLPRYVINNYVMQENLRLMSMREDRLRSYYPNGMSNGPLPPPSSMNDLD
ncbi:hypothetical protein ACJIZ3_019736 [Penstemon smallii]|uniref:Uncharacterized protein n=1 Tax=Penstemon smallii TaxID=265156 RepID=A0ABD3T1Z5_9LAMI